MSHATAAGRARVLAVVAACLAALALALPLARPADALSPAVVLADDFEQDAGAWTGRGAATVATTAEHGPRGARSLLVTGRTASWHGATVPVTDAFEPGVTYTVGLWLRLPAGADPADLRVSVQRDDAGTPAYDTVATVAGVRADAWTQVLATYTPGPFTSAALYVESPSSLTDFLLDDVLVSGVRHTPDLSLPSVADVLADDFPFGIAAEPADLLGGRGELLAHHAAQITPGNQLKPDAVQPTEGTFTFGPADRVVDWAVAHGKRVYGHTLLWHQQTPDWFFQRPDGTPLTTSAEDRALLRERLRTHVEAVADHLRERYGAFGTPGNPVVAFDVVNEVVDEGQPDGLRRSEWYRVLGPSYVADAFRYARDAFGPEVLLFVNDYNTELPAKRAPYLRLVTDLLAQGVPVDGVGHQLHVEVGRSIASAEATLTAFAALPVRQAVTELDVSTYRHAGESWAAPPADRLLEQAEYYRDMVAMLRRHADLLESVTVWGLEDSRTWLRAGAAPLLFDGALQAKPAYWGVVDPPRIGATPTATPTPTSTPTPTPTPTATPTPTPTPTTTPIPPPPSPSVTPPPPLPPYPTCRVAWTAHAWPTGFTASVRITALTVPVDGWTLRFSTRSSDQRLAQGWSATWWQTGFEISARDAGWNARIAPGRSVEIGFNGTHGGTVSRPTQFLLNGLPCENA